MICGNDFGGPGKEILFRKQSDKRKRSPQLYSGWSKRYEAGETLPKLLGCKIDNGRIVLSNLQN